MVLCEYSESQLRVHVNISGARIKLALDQIQQSRLKKGQVERRREDVRALKCVRQVAVLQRRYCVDSASCHDI